MNVSLKYKKHQQTGDKNEGKLSHYFDYSIVCAACDCIWMSYSISNLLEEYNGTVKISYKASAWILETNPLHLMALHMQIRVSCG